MRLLKKILKVQAISAVCLLLLANLIHAEERYISDSIIVSLREGPGPQYNVIKTLRTGQSFEVVETRNNFIRVRTKDGDMGWLQAQFTSSKPSSATKEATPPVERKQAQPSPPVTVSQPQQNTPEPTTNEESVEVKRLQTELAEITKQFSELEDASQSVLLIEAENDRMKKELATMQDTLAQLKQENSTLASREEIYWFLAGAGIFFLGMLIGRISIRRKRHQSSLTL